MNAMKSSLLKNFMIPVLKVNMESSAEHAKDLIMPQDEEIIMHIGLENISVKKNSIFFNHLMQFCMR